MVMTIIKMNLEKKFRFKSERFILKRYKNKSEIFQGFKYHIESEGAEHRLVINKLCMDDEAKYTCKINEVETYAHLTITR